MRVLALLALCLLVNHAAVAFVVVSPSTQHRPALFMSATEEDTKPKDTDVDAATTDAPADEPEPVVASKWASESNVKDPRYEEKEDDSPAMKAGKALKPLNDLVETVVGSPLLGPVLFLAPILGNPKVRAEIMEFFSSLSSTQ